MLNKISNTNGGMCQNVFFEPVFDPLDLVFEMNLFKLKHKGTDFMHVYPFD